MSLNIEWCQKKGFFFFALIVIIEPIHIKDRIISKPHTYQCRHFCAAQLFIGYHIDVAHQAELLLSAALQREIILVLLTASFVWLQSQGQSELERCQANADIKFPWALSNNYKLVNHNGKSLSHGRERETLANNSANWAGSRDKWKWGEGVSDSKILTC